MLLGVIADDFTGASDIANTLAKGLPGQGGLRTAQFLGLPTARASDDIEAGVVALKSRSIPAADAVAAIAGRARLAPRAGLPPDRFQVLLDIRLDARGQYRPGRRGARREARRQGRGRLPGLPDGRTHGVSGAPVRPRPAPERVRDAEPSPEPDDGSGHPEVAGTAVAGAGRTRAVDHRRPGADCIRAALEEAGRRNATLAIVDAITDDDLVAIGSACRRRKADHRRFGDRLGLPANFIEEGLATGQQAAPVGGRRSGGHPGRQLLGRDPRSRSASTPRITRCLPSASTMSWPDESLRPISWLSFAPTRARRRSSTPRPTRSRSPRRSRATGGRASRRALDRLFADTARALLDGGVRRLVVAGGETSGAVVSALDLGALTIGPEIDPGVPVLVSERTRVGLALKSGNFGAPDFFRKALDKLAGAA